MGACLNSFGHALRSYYPGNENAQDFMQNIVMGKPKDGGAAMEALTGDNKV